MGWSIKYILFVFGITWNIHYIKYVLYIKKKFVINKIMEWYLMKEIITTDEKKCV